MVGKTALNKERYHLNGGPFQTLIIDNYNFQKTYIKAQLWMM